jgi:predicted lipoprotein with Yx(FWY)xxD motif
MRRMMKVLIPTLAVTVLISACGSSSSNQSGSAGGTGATSSQASSSAVQAVKTAFNSKLGATVLVNSQGMTLYHLSAEHSGKFICTSACEHIWHPLVAKAGGTPTGAVGSLATVKRPDGTLQVTYKGMPLYTFTHDTAPGQANGQGIKDVGTWSAVAVSNAGGATTAATTGTESSSGSSYGGSGGGSSGSYGY